MEAQKTETVAEKMARMRAINNAKRCKAEREQVKRSESELREYYHFSILFDTMIGELAAIYDDPRLTHALCKRREVMSKDYWRALFDRPLCEIRETVLGWRV